MSRSMWFSLSVTLALLAMAPNVAAQEPEGRQLPTLVPSFDGERGSTPYTDPSSASRNPFKRMMDNFTPEQTNRMRCTIENWRPNLPRPLKTLAGR